MSDYPPTPRVSEELFQSLKLQAELAADKSLRNFEGRNIDDGEMDPFGNTIKHDDYALPGPTSFAEGIPVRRSDGKLVVMIEGHNVIINEGEPTHGWGLASDETFAAKLKEAREDLQRAQSKATGLLLEIDNLMAHFQPTNNPQEMTPSEESLKTLIEHGFQKLEASIATIKEANQKASTCVCDKVNLKRAKPNEEHVKDGISGEGS